MFRSRPQLAVLFDFVEVEVHLFGRAGDAADFDAHGVGNVSLHQMLHGRFDGGREEHGLPPGGDGGHDPLDGGQEAHVQHAVGLIQHQDADCGQIHQLAAQEIVKAARSGDHHRAPLRID